MQGVCTKALFTHIHIKGMYSRDDGKLLVRDWQYGLGFFSPLPRWIYIFESKSYCMCAELVFHNCSYPTPCWSKNNASQSDVSGQLRTSSPCLWTGASVARRNDLNGKTPHVQQCTLGIVFWPPELHFAYVLQLTYGQFLSDDTSFMQQNWIPAVENIFRKLSDHNVCSEILSEASFVGKCGFTWLHLSCT